MKKAEHTQKKKTGHGFNNKIHAIKWKAWVKLCLKYRCLLSKTGKAKALITDALEFHFHGKKFNWHNVMSPKVSLVQIKILEGVMLIHLNFFCVLSRSSTMHQIKIHMNNTLWKTLRDLKEMDQNPNLTHKNKPAKTTSACFATYISQRCDWCTLSTIILLPVHVKNFLSTNRQ